VEGEGGREALIKLHERVLRDVSFNSPFSIAYSKMRGHCVSNMELD
jgi:hypothetical protein